MHDYWVAIIPVVLTVLVSGFGFAVRGYFATVHKAIDDLRLEMGKIHGELRVVHADLKDNTVQLTKVGTELKAVWRYIDNAPQRASDRRASNGGD